MSSSFSANQYDSAFKTQRLQNWCETKHFKERPTAQEGHTTFIANDRGHLLPGVVKRGNAWPDFKGTWDLPARIPAHCVNPTARSVEGLKRLKTWGLDPQHTGKSQPQRGSKNADKDVDKQQDGTAPSSAAEVRPSSQSRPITGGEITRSKNLNAQEAVVGSVTCPSEETGNDRPLSQCPAAEEKPALTAAADEGTNTDTGTVRPVSNTYEKAAGPKSTIIV